MVEDYLYDNRADASCSRALRRFFPGESAKHVPGRSARAMDGGNPLGGREGAGVGHPSAVRGGRPAHDVPRQKVEVGQDGAMRTPTRCHDNASKLEIR